MDIDRYTIRLAADELANRTFLLGDEGGFVLYLPVEENTRDQTLLPIKWFGASEFGRKFFEANVVWLERDGQRTMLNRSNQTGFEQYLDRAVRIFEADGCTVRQTFFVPTQLRAFVMTLEADRAATFVVEPEFDMRYYQAFNTNFDKYSAQEDEGGAILCVSNHIEAPAYGKLDFCCCIAAGQGEMRIELLPEGERLRRRVYRAEEKRAELIENAYAETHVKAPDEAPIWDEYETTVYVPAVLTGRGPLGLIYAFGDRPGEAERTARRVDRDLDAERRDKRADVEARLEQGELTTGSDEVDTAYAQVLTRFNNALVARDVTVQSGDGEIDHWYAIFAGNKYFLDAWTRDENISLIALLETDDYTTLRAILDETWRHQDRRTGRLPHIIRLGERLVYYSSDGTLWALYRLHQYTRASGDTSLLDEKYPLVEHFFEASLNFVQRGLLPSGGIIDKSYLWETWEDTPYTPRDGYPVEIELLWLTNLDRFLPVIRDRNPNLAKRLESTLEEGRETFKSFYLDGYLADGLTYQWEPRRELTPNGYIAFAVDYPLPPELKRSMVLLARDQLAGGCGIRSLAPRDWPNELSAEFLADRKLVTKSGMASVGLYNYHRGIEWLWLNQFFVDAELQCGSTDVGYKLYVVEMVQRAIYAAGVGGLGELYDLKGPEGADFQAWSMASFIASMHAFSGIRIDGLDRTIAIRPSPPEDWPHLLVRRKAADTRFDVCYERRDTTQRIEVRALDAPQPYTIRLGIRVLAGNRPARITLNGEDVPPERWQVVPGCTPDADGEAWIETPWEERLTAEFHG